MAHHNCAPARNAVNRCERALGEILEKIKHVELDNQLHPGNPATINFLKQLYAERENKKAELSNAEMALEECEAQNTGDQ